MLLIVVIIQEQIEDTASRVDVASVHSQQLEKKIKQFDKVSTEFFSDCVCLTGNFLRLFPVEKITQIVSDLKNLLRLCPN